MSHRTGRGPGCLSLRDITLRAVADLKFVHPLPGCREAGSGADRLVREPAPLLQDTRLVGPEVTGAACRTRRRGCRRPREGRRATAGSTVRVGCACPCLDALRPRSSSNLDSSSEVMPTAPTVRSDHRDSGSRSQCRALRTRQPRNEETPPVCHGGQQTDGAVYVRCRSDSEGPRTVRREQRTALRTEFRPKRVQGEPVVLLPLAPDPLQVVPESAGAALVDQWRCTVLGARP